MERRNSGHQFSPPCVKRKKTFPILNRQLKNSIFLKQETFPPNELQYMRKQIQRYIDNKVNPLEHPIPLPEFAPPSPRPPDGAAAFPQPEIEPTEERAMSTPAEPNPQSPLNAATPGNLLPPSPVTELISESENPWSREENGS